MQKISVNFFFKKLSHLHNINYSHSICFYLLQCKKDTDVSSFYHQFSVSFLYLVLTHLYLELNICEDYHSCSSRELVKHSTNIPAIFLLHLDQSLARPVSSMVFYFLLIALVWKSMLSVCHFTTHDINHEEVPRALMLLQKYSMWNQQMFQGKM